MSTYRPSLVSIPVQVGGIQQHDRAIDREHPVMVFKTSADRSRGDSNPVHVGGIEFTLRERKIPEKVSGIQQYDRAVYLEHPVLVLKTSADRPRPRGDSIPVQVGGVKDDSEVDLDENFTIFMDALRGDATQVEMRGIEHDSAVDSDEDFIMCEDTPRESSLDPDKDFTMFEDTPRDSSLVEAWGKMACPPYDQVELDGPPSLAKLASIPIWSPELDEEYLIEEKR